MTAVAFVADDEKKRRSWPAVVAASAVVGLIAAGLAWLAHSWFATGPQPSEALPASTLAYVAIDLDPAGEQKIEAMEVLDSFPALGKTSDVRKRLLGLVAESGECDVPYDAVDGWMGERLALAVVPVERPEPVLVIRLDGDRGLEKGLESVGECFGRRHGSAHTDEWAVVARSEAIAEQVLKAGEENPLSEDDEFRRWTAEAGDPGIVTMYAAPEAGDALLAAVDRDPELAWMLNELPLGGDPVLAMFPIWMFVPFDLTDDFGDFGYEVCETDPESTDCAELHEEDPCAVDSDSPACEEFAGLTESEILVEERHLHPDPAYADGKLTYEDVEQGPTAEDFDRMMKLPEDQQAAAFDEAFSRGPRLMEADGTWRPLTPAETEQWKVLEKEFNAQMEAEFEARYGDDFEDEWDAPELAPEVRDALADFEGAAGVVRFEDGAAELELAMDHLDGLPRDLAGGAGGGEGMAGLPEGTVAAYGISPGPDFAANLIEMISNPFGFGEDEVDLAALEKGTGLDLPGDLTTLGGTSATVVAGDLAGMDPFMDEPEELELAVRIEGDTEAIGTALDKLASKNKGLRWKVDRDAVLVGANEAFLDSLVGGSGLTDGDRFDSAVPGAGDAHTVFFLDFDAEDWLVRGAGKNDAADAKPFDTLGMTRSSDGDLDKIVVRLSFD